MSDSVISSTYTGNVYDSSTASTASKTTGVESGMGLDAFLKMFMAQLTNQDPLNPMDNTEFTAQLATFSQLEQLTKISKSLESLGKVETAIVDSQMVGYIGKEVTLSGDAMPVSNGYVGPVGYELAAPAYVKAMIFDSEGTTVADIDLGQMTSGAHEFQWDGKNLAGQTADDGTYRVSFIATNASGETVEVSNQTVSGLVTGYQKGADGASYLLMGKTALKSTSVLSVKQPSSSATSSTSTDSESLSALTSLLGGLAALL